MLNFKHKSTHLEDARQARGVLSGLPRVERQGDPLFSCISNFLTRETDVLLHESDTSFDSYLLRIQRLG